VPITETKHTAPGMEATGGAAVAVLPVLRPKQSKYVAKVTFDARQISKTKAQAASPGHAAADPGRRGGPDA
jgi:hypothetical protein